MSARAALRLLFTALVWMMSCWSTSAIAAEQRLSQYEHVAWRKQDGVIATSNAIAQTRDGYLWIATNAGLFRFDGVRFVARNVFNGVSLAGWRIGTVYAARDGSLWIGAFGKVGHLVAGRLEQYDIRGWVNEFSEDNAGVVWFAQSRVNFKDGPLCSIVHRSLACLGRPTVPHANLGPLKIDADGSFWFGGPEGLCHWQRPGPVNCYLHDILGPDYEILGVQSILRTRDGVLWVGIGKANHPFGIGRFADGRWSPVIAPDGSSLDVTSLAEGADGALWVGTEDRGVYRIRGAEIDHYGSVDGLSDDTVNDLAVDAEGTVWVATDGGLDALRKSPISVFSTREGLPANDVSAVAAAADGTMLIGDRPLAALRDDKPAAVPFADFFRGKRTTALLVDHLGREWVGTDGSLVVVDGTTLRTVTDAAGHPTGVIIEMIEGAAHSIWARTAGPLHRLLRIDQFKSTEVSLEGRLASMAPDPEGDIVLAFEGGAVTRLMDATSMPMPNGLPEENAIVKEADGSLFSMSRKGILIQRGVGRWFLDTDHGLPCEGVYAMLRDRRGAAWLLLRCGIARIEASELERWISHPTTSIGVRLLDSTDGFQSGDSGFRPRAALAPDGRLWFASDKFVQVVDPATSMIRHPPPPVIVDEVVADRTTYRIEGALRLPQRTRDLEIRYNALSFIQPRKIRFKYRLEGRDRDWTDADTRREAFYTDLAPGSYRFKVIACNSDGVWNEGGASVDFEIAAAFWQTRWFAILCAAIGLSLVYLVYLLRLRQIAARYQDRLATKNAERERIARELHDTLLQSTEGLVLIFHAASNRLSPGDPSRSAIDRALQRASALIAEGRDRVQDLRHAGAGIDSLPDALRALGDGLATTHRVDFSLDVEGAPPAFDPLVNDEAWLVLREALRNAFAHAAAKSIEVSLLYLPDGFHGRVSDDGRGIDFAALEGQAASGHWGVKGMQERAARIGARLEIRSRLGGGAEVELFVPASSAYRVRPRRFERLRRLVPLRRRDHPIG